MKRSPTILNWQPGKSVCLFCALLGLGLAAVSPAGAQHKSHRAEPRFVSSGEPDPARGREVMSAFRKLGLPGDYFMEFDLEVLPRRGKRSTVLGRMWGSRNEVGPITRVDLAATTAVPRTQLITQNGPNAAAWRHIESIDTDATELDQTAIMEDMAGTGLRIFELQMPFIHWPDYVFEGTTRVRGRTVHAFLMYPPEDFSAAHPEITGVRLHLDIKFHALMQAVVLGAEQEALRKLTVLDLKKLGDQWMVKSIEVRDEVTRDKVKFEVTGAALGLDFSPQLFAAEELSQSLETPEGVRRF